MHKTAFTNTNQTFGLVSRVWEYRRYPIEGRSKMLLSYIEDTIVKTKIAKLSEMNNIYEEVKRGYGVWM